MARAKSVFSLKKPYPGWTASAPLRVIASRMAGDVEVALGRRLPAEGVGLVGEAHVQGVAVELGVHGDGGDPELPAGADDPHRDLPPVGDQDLGQHRGQPIVRGCSATESAASRETTSTNTVALAAGAAGEPEGYVVVADHQTAGRGRLDRAWVAAPGTGLLVSVLLRPAPATAHLAVSALACAAAAACERVAGVSPSLKWPNDLVVGDRKLAGVLAETSGNVACVVVGLGLNVHAPTDRPPEIVAVDLDALAGRRVPRGDVLDALLMELGWRYEHLDRVLDEYRRRCSTIGSRVARDHGRRLDRGPCDRGRRRREPGRGRCRRRSDHDHRRRCRTPAAGVGDCQSGARYGSVGPGIAHHIGVRYVVRPTWPGRSC